MLRVMVGLLVIASACGGDATPSVTVTPIAGRTSESGGAAVITVVLTEPPSAAVSFGVESSVPEEGLPDVDEVVFTPDDWDVAKTVIVRGVDDGSGDNSEDGPRPYDISFGRAVSTDGRFAGLEPPSVRLTNFDNDVRFDVFDTSDPEKTLGWSLLENGGPLVLGIVLADEPYEEVSFGLNLYMHGTASPPVTEANPQLGIAEDLNVSFDAFDAAKYYTEFTITPEDFDQPRQIVIAPVADRGSDDPGKIFDLAIGAIGDKAYVDHIANLNVMRSIPYRIVNVDPDSTNVIVTPQPLRICLGKTLNATVQLSSDPGGDVNVSFTPSDSRLTATPAVTLSSTAPASFTLGTVGTTHDAAYSLDVRVTTAPGPPYDSLVDVIESYEVQILVDGDATTGGNRLGEVSQFCIP